MQGHLAAGVGHYHHLLFRLQIEFKLDLHGSVDFPLLVYDKGLKKDKVSSFSKTLDSSCVNWAKQATHRCLVYLGDLSRYILDLHPHWDAGLAVRYYSQALNMNIDIGMPHNQLGTLAGTCNYGLDAAYHYMRCLTCKQPFEGAEGNLQRLMEKNTQWLEQHPVDDNISVQHADRIHQLISRFLLLADIWFFDKKSLVESHQVCHQVLLDLQHCLAYTKPFPNGSDCEMKGGQVDLEHLSIFEEGEENKERPEYLKDDLIFKMIAMLLLCVTKLQAGGSQQVSAVVAFTLAMLSQLIQQVIHHIQDSVFSMSFPSFTSPLPTVSPSLELEVTALSVGEGNIKAAPRVTSMNQQLADKSCTGEKTVDLVNGCAGENESQEAQAVVKKKRSKRLQRLRKRRRRRRRRLNSSEDSDLSDGDYPYGEGSSSSDDANSSISESTEPGLDLSSDDEEEEDDDDDDEVDDVDVTAKELYRNSDSIIVNEVVEAHGKTPNLISAKGELNKVNGLKLEKKCDRLRANLCSPPTNINGLGEVENGCSDGLAISSSSSNNLDAVVSKEIDNENRDVDNGGMKNGRMIDPADVIELVSEEGLLDAIKVCADWLHGDSDIIKACGHSSRTLLSRFVTLLNLIYVNADALEKGLDVGQVIQLKNVGEMFRKIPLPEDVMLKGLPVLKNSHDAVDWEYLHHHCLHAKEEALLRVYKLVEFGHFLASIPDTGVRYDSGQKLFSIASETDVSGEMSEEKIKETAAANHTQDEEGDEAENNDRSVSAPNTKSSSRRGELMHHMGQLWLRAEVRDLESRVRHRGATFSPYLAVDSDALIHHMHLVKQLVGARKFIILIPSVVVSALDELKREIGRARETIRWLESQFQRGNRFLRAQRSHECLPLPRIKYPKKKDKEAWLFFQVVECCHYFSKQTGAHETALVTLLTGQKSYVSGGGTKDEATKGFSSLGVAKVAGINLEHIESFHAKWKTSSKSHG